MTPLLQQARGALAAFANPKFCETLSGNVQGDKSPIYERNGAVLKLGDFNRAAAALAALDAYEALSDYDKAIEALAPYLPDGFVAQDEDGEICLFKEGEPHIHEKTVWIGGFAECIPLNVRCPDWRTSLRRIQGGRVVPQGESG